MERWALGAVSSRRLKPLASPPYEDAFAHLTALALNASGTADGLVPGNGDNPACQVVGRTVRDGDRVWTPDTPRHPQADAPGPADSHAPGVRD